MPCQIIPFPQELRPQLPTIVGNVDYLTLRQRWEQIDALVRDSGAERDFVQRALDGQPPPADPEGDEGVVHLDAAEIALVRTGGRVGVEEGRKRGAGHGGERG